ncbi:hypothetical protein N9891_02080, partial [bacterium]|nr:hypothetical protein [bacterium]
MNFKLSAFLAASLLSSAHSQTGDPQHQETTQGLLVDKKVHCVNGNKIPECDFCDDSDGVVKVTNNVSECDENGDPYSLLSGNVSRGVRDLTFWNTPGEMKFTWKRLAASRKIDSGAPTYFGDSHQWLHNWDVTLVDAGLDPGTNTRLMEIRYPNGYLSTFREKANGTAFNVINSDWRGQDRLWKKSVAGGDSFDGFEVVTGAGKTLRFVERDFGAGTFYRFEELADRMQNSYTLSYQSGSVDHLSRVTAPGGTQYFELTWGTSAEGFDVIEKVTSSDGRSATYVYNGLIDPADSSAHDGLTGVDYSDGTFAKYRYNWERFPSGRPLLDEARDTRVVNGARVVGYEYYGWLFGMVSKELNAFDDSLLSSRVEDTENGLLEFTAGNGGKRVIQPDFGAGKILSDINTTGGQTTYTYGGFLNRETKTITDSNGEKKTISWREGMFLRPTRVLYDEDGGARHEERFNYTSTGLLNFKVSAPAGGGWHVTRYTRNASGHLTKILYPGGSSEAWTRNAYGDPLTHTLRNGATESWTYNLDGLKETHSGPAKAGETGASQSWTYYNTGLVHVHTLATGGTVSYEYNDLGQVTKETYDDNSYTERAYDGTSIDFYGNAQVFPDVTSVKKYDSVEQTIDEWTYTYDPFGRKETATDPLTHTTSWDYGDAGQGICNTCTTKNSPLRVTSAAGKETRYFYDTEWRPVFVAHRVNNEGENYEGSATLYDAEGRVLYRIDNIVLDGVDPATLDFSDYAQVG